MADHDLNNASRRRFLGYTGAGMLVGLLPGCGGGNDAPPYSQTIAWGRQTIQAAIAGGVPAISIALIKNGEMVWQQAFGTISDTGTPATIQTAFNIASVSKVFAALAAMILQDRKLITLDTPIVQYLPTFSMLSPEYVGITTRHLLSHSSGLPGNNAHDFISFAPLPGYAENTVAALANAHLKHRPGELAVYCNDGFTLFEQVVAAVTGQSFTAFVQENILAPLDMTHSGFMTSTLLAGQLAHDYVGGKWYSTPEYVNAYAAGGLTSTPGDMMKFAQMLLTQGVYRGRRIVSAAGIAEMARDQTQAVGVSIYPTPDFPWGLGWDTGMVKSLHSLGITAWQKNGDTAFANALFVLPGVQMALMVSGYAGYERAALAENILLRALVEDGTIAALPAAAGTTPAPAAGAPDMADSTGIYANYKTILKVAINAGTLSLDEWNGSGWTPYAAGQYRYGSDGWWWSSSGEGPSFSFTVVSGTDKAGKAYSYRYLMGRTPANAGYALNLAPGFQQLDAGRPALSQAWQARMGSQWRVTNESTQTMRYALTSGVLRASISQLPGGPPGYILMRNCDDSGNPTYQMLLPLADDRAGMAVKIPVLDGRDLWEASFTTANGTPAMTIAGMNYAPVV